MRIEKLIVALVAGVTLACSADDGGSASSGGNTGGGSGGGLGGGSSSNPPSNPQPSAGCGTPASQTGTFASIISVVTQQDGTQVRDYWTVVPADYDGSRPLALIFNWHGLGNDAQQAISWLGVVNEAGSEAIHVFPQKPGGAGWNILERGPDVPLYDALLAHLLATYCVDQNRVYGIGHSAGTQLNAELACLRTESLRAIANVSGLWNVVPNSNCVPMNYMFLYGEQDSTVNTTNALGAITFTTGCSENGTPVTDPAVGGTCTDYTECNEGSSVRWCSHPGGHDWPQPFANQAIWTFLQTVW